MKEKNTETFVMVNYDLLASQKLTSTQKLFISYVIGWQKNNRTCIETNNTLAIKFGLKYGGVRSLINQLNKTDFFKSVAKNFDNTTNTSGHEITVDEKKLMDFLNSHKPEKETISTEPEPELVTNTNIVDSINSIRPENDLDPDQNETKPTIQYRDEDIISVQEIMTDLEFNQADIIDFINHFGRDKVTFYEFSYRFSGLNVEQKNKHFKENYKGILISDEQMEKLCKMIIE